MPQACKLLGVGEEKERNGGERSLGNRSLVFHRAHCATGLARAYGGCLGAGSDQIPALARQAVDGLFSLGYWRVDYFGEDSSSAVALLLLCRDDMVRNRLIHRLDHVGDIGSHVRAKGGHQRN